MASEALKTEQAPASKDNSDAKREERTVEDLADDERRKRTVFVGNVPLETKKIELKRLFKQFGKVEAVRLRGVFPNSPKIPKKVALLARRLNKNVDSLLAYVVFKTCENTKEVVEAACKELNMKELNGKHLRVTPAEITKHPVRSSIFLGNLPFDVNEEDVIRTFQDAVKDSGSKVVQVRVSRDGKTGLGRGVGFVTFNDDLGVRFCLSKAGSIAIKGRTVRMERAQKEKKNKTKTAKRMKRTREKSNRKRRKTTGGFSKDK